MNSPRTTLSTPSTFYDINRQYTERKYNELNAILHDNNQWREFQDLLQGSTYGITNSSVKENLLTLLRTKASLQKKTSSVSSVLQNTSRRDQYNERRTTLSLPPMCTLSPSCSSSSSSSDGSFSSDEHDIF
jgi:hypothetical protein